MSDNDNNSEHLRKLRCIVSNFNADLNENKINFSDRVFILSLIFISLNECTYDIYGDKCVEEIKRTIDIFYKKIVDDFDNYIKSKKAEHDE